MRKIEEEMVAALHEGKDWRKDNTEVYHLSMDHNSADVLLFGNRIARVWRDSSGHLAFNVDIEILSQHPTRTTISRLQALGVDVRKWKGEILLDGEPI